MRTRIVSENVLHTYKYFSRRSMEVPADFLDTISEEKNENKQTTGQQIAKKYPFNRTTTPNSLREHLKETLTKNLGGNFFCCACKK